MKFKITGVDITFFICCTFLISLSVIGSIIIGTLVHESMHKHYSHKPILLQINYDGSGLMSSTSFWPHSHAFVYFTEYIVFGCLMLMLIFSFFVLLNYKNMTAKEYSDKVWEYIEQKIQHKKNIYIK